MREGERERGREGGGREGAREITEKIHNEETETTKTNGEEAAVTVRRRHGGAGECQEFCVWGRSMRNQYAPQAKATARAARAGAC
jgi:hypothetical protein